MVDLSSTFISIYRYIREDGDPYQWYIEIDSHRREVRKIVLFAGGRCERVGGGNLSEEFPLSADPVIEFTGEISTGKDFLEEIDGAWFEKLWGEAGDGVMKFADDPEAEF